MDSPLTSPDRLMVGFRTPGPKIYSPYGEQSPATPITISSVAKSPDHESNELSFMSPPPTTRFFNSPPFSPMSPTDLLGGPSPSGPLKRGRPRASMISALIENGKAASASAIKCEVCGRVFPREKSVQAHMRTHTGERPYPCDFPGCTKSFCQSGQLRTHQRLHAGEKPYICRVDNCGQRFTHINRTCPSHPNVPLVRDTSIAIPSIDDYNLSLSVQTWLHKYAVLKQQKTPNKRKSSLSQSGTKRSLYPDLENQYQAAQRQTLIISRIDNDNNHLDNGRLLDSDRCLLDNDGRLDNHEWELEEGEVAGEEIVAKVDDQFILQRDSRMSFHKNNEVFVPPTVQKVVREETVLPLDKDDHEVNAEDLRLTTISGTSHSHIFISPPRLSSSGLAVSVIRRASPTASSPRFVSKPGVENLSLPAQRMFLINNSLYPHGSFHFGFHGPTISPTKSPRKQAALALIQLSASDKTEWCHSNE